MCPVLWSNKSCAVFYPILRIYIYIYIYILYILYIRCLLLLYPSKIPYIHYIYMESRRAINNDIAAPNLGFLSSLAKKFPRAGPCPRECFCLRRKILGFRGYIMFIFSGKLHGLSTGLRPLPHSFGRLCLKYEKSIKFTTLWCHQNHPLKSVFQKKIQF